MARVQELKQAQSLFQYQGSFRRESRHRSLGLKQNQGPTVRPGLNQPQGLGQAQALHVPPGSDRLLDEKQAEGPEQAQWLRPEGGAGEPDRSKRTDNRPYQAG